MNVNDEYTRAYKRKWKAHEAKNPPSKLTDIDVNEITKKYKNDYKMEWKACEAKTRPLGICVSFDCNRVGKIGDKCNECGFPKKMFIPMGEKDDGTSNKMCFGICKKFSTKALIEEDDETKRVATLIEDDHDSDIERRIGGCPNCHRLGILFKDCWNCGNMYYDFPLVDEFGHKIIDTNIINHEKKGV